MTTSGGNKTRKWRQLIKSTLTLIKVFPCGSAGKESTCNGEDLGSIPGLGRSPGEGKGYPRQYSGLENFMDCIVHGVAKSWTQLSDFHFHVHAGYPGGTWSWLLPGHFGSEGRTHISRSFCPEG